MGAFISLCRSAASKTYWAVLFSLLIVFAVLPLAAGAQQAEPQTDAAAELTSEELSSQQQLVNSLLSLSETLGARQEQLRELTKTLERTKDEAKHAPLQAEIERLGEEILQAEQEINLVVLGLQARQYNKDGTEPEAVDIKKEIAQVFEPIVMSLERATEPTRRMEELRQLAVKAEQRMQTTQATLDNIAIFKNADVKYPKDVQERLDKYEALWENRLQEAQSVGNALDEQLLAARRAQGNSFKHFSQDFGNFILNRGASLFMALGLGLAFALLCQLIRIAAALLYRRTHGGVLSASMRVFSMLMTLIGVVGGFVIALTIFNIRHDWLMLAMSLLLALAVSWTFVRSLPALMEQMRVLLNLGAVREGERTLVGGLPYRIDRLSVYSKLVNPELKGGTLIYPVRELIGMHSRPVTPGEAWFPTKDGDWIVRAGRHYQVKNQTPEHVILRRPGGAEDFVPAQEFMDTLFEVITDGYRAKYEFGLAYKHLAGAQKLIPETIDEIVRTQIAETLGKDALVSVETRFVGLGDSALQFEVLADLGPGFGSHWQKMQKYLNRAVVDACLENKWDIPYPQLVVHTS